MQHKTIKEPEFARIILVLNVPGLKFTADYYQTMKGETLIC